MCGRITLTRPNFESIAAELNVAPMNYALTRHTEDGRLKIDNNQAEQALRPIVLGRKNWLFAGSEAAAHRTAILCSLVQSCKHLQINPFVYLRDVIERVSTHPARLVLELTPRELKRLRLAPGAQASARLLR
jgi:transposase